MNWDNLFVALAIAGALLFFARRLFARKKPGCGGGCGCEVAKKGQFPLQRPPAS